MADYHPPSGASLRNSGETAPKGTLLCNESDTLCWGLGDGASRRHFHDVAVAPASTLRILLDGSAVVPSLGGLGTGPQTYLFLFTPVCKNPKNACKNPAVRAQLGRATPK